MYELKLDPSFRSDYKKFKKQHPNLIDDLRIALEELTVTGTVSDHYHPHRLENPGGNYNGHIDFHIGPEEIDVVVLYLPHKTNPIIRLVRIGSHSDLFKGPLT